MTTKYLICKCGKPYGYKQNNRQKYFKHRLTSPQLCNCTPPNHSHEVEA